jgi:hypothetical protein
LKQSKGYKVLKELADRRVCLLTQELINKVRRNEDGTGIVGEIDGITWVFNEVKYINNKIKED